MRSIDKVISRHPEYATMIRAVIKRIGEDSIHDINENGISGGFSGFIYYTDTVAFFRLYKKYILTMLREDADSLGEDMLEMISKFNCFMYWNRAKNKNESVQSIDDIGRALYGRYDSNLDHIYNALAWYAAETICRYFED